MNVRKPYLRLGLNLIKPNDQDSPGSATHQYQHNEMQKNVRVIENNAVLQIYSYPDDNPNVRDTLSFEIKCQAKFYAKFYVWQDIRDI